MSTELYADITADELAMFMQVKKQKSARITSTKGRKPKVRKSKAAIVQVLQKDGYKYIPINDRDDLKQIVKTYKKPKYRKNLYARMFWEQERW